MSIRRPAVLAVDGGNSKTDLALVARSGELLALVGGLTISHQQVPLEVAMGRLRGLAHEAASRAGARLPAGIGSFCVAGADFSSDIAVLRRGIGAIDVADRITVRNDAFAALRAGAPEGWGVALVCGSGVNAVGIGPDGRTARLAAIDDLSGDFGGGYGLGLEALGLAVRARDGRGRRTSLEQLVPGHFGLRRPLDVTRAIYEGRIERRRLEELAPGVFAEAGKGDVVARALIDRLADELATMATAIIHRLHVTRRSPEVVLVGGVFRSSDPAFRERLGDGIRRAAPGARIARLEARPVLGSALLGLDALGVRPGGAAEDRLRRAFEASSPA
jgi:N-acetylglucosamine kinase-like BadF-type ATPase